MAPSAEQEKWDERYRTADRPAQAAQVLIDNLQRLPPTGTALDLACGLGGNALQLARQGLQVEAWDISPVAITKLSQQAGNLPIQGRIIDINIEPLPVAAFDVITVSYFLERRLAPALIEALRPNGLLFYQTYNQNQLGRGPSTPAWRLQPGELRQLFAALKICDYREEADVAMLVAQKTSSEQ